MLNAQRLNWRGHSALTVYVKLYPKSDAYPAQLEHAAAEAGAAHGRFHRLREVFPTLHQRAPGIGIEQEDFIVAVARPRMDRITGFQLHQRHAFKRRADLGNSI